MPGTTTEIGVAYITVFQNNRGILGKQAWVDKGRLASKAFTSLWDGTAITVEAETATQLALLLEGCKTNQALGLGTLLGIAANVSVAITTDDHAKTHPNGALARTQDNLGFVPGQPGWMLLDFDRDEMPDRVKARLRAARGLWKLIVGEVPGLAGAKRVRRMSTLSGLSANGVSFPASGGEHIYIRVADCSDIPRAIRVLKQRLMSAGLAWIKVSGAGQRLPRTIIDGAVGLPERLVFEGAPDLRPPLVQNRPRCEIHEGKTIDTAVAIPDLDTDEERLLGTILAPLKAAAAPEAEAARKANIRKVAERRSKQTGEPVDTIERKLSGQNEGYLPLDWPIETDDFGIVTVAEILADRRKFAGAKCHDPLEPVLGPNKAIIFDEGTGLFSHAHGGQKFHFGERPDPSVVFADPPGVARPQDSVDAAQARMAAAITKIIADAVLAAGEEQENRAALKGAAGVVSRAGRVFGPVVETPFGFAETAPAVGETPVATAATFSDIGLGKTEITLGELVGQARLGKDGMAVFGPGVPGLGLRVGFVVNDHKLAAEIASRCNNLLPGVASVWFGTEAEDPNAPGQQMCRRAPDMVKWRKAGGEAATLCAGCPLNARSVNPCGYDTQACDTPIVVLAGPSTLTHRQPKRLRRRLRMALRDGGARTVEFPPFDMVIVDETRPQDLLAGFDPMPEIVSPATVAGRLRPPNGMAACCDRWTPAREQQFDTVVARIHSTMLTAMRSPVSRGRRRLTFAEIRSMGASIEAWEWLRARFYELLVKPDPKIGNHTGAGFEAALAPVAGWNGEVSMLARLCDAAIQSLGADSQGDTDETPFIEVTGKGFLLRWRRELSPDFAGLGVPTLILDATGDEDLLKVFWPKLDVIARGRAKLPDGVTVLSVEDSLCAYRGWVPKPIGLNPSATARNDHRRAINNATRLSDMLDVLAASCREEGGVGFIGPKVLVEELERRWRKRGSGRPPGLVIGHFGAIRGVDAFRGVRALVVWSRPAVPPNEAEQLAGVLFGRKVQEVPGWYDRGGTHIMRKGGCRDARKGERHPDASAEIVRAQVSDAEVDQAIGRARALRRSKAKPLLIVKGTAAPSSRIEIDKLLPVDEILKFDAIDALGARGVWFDNFQSKGALDLLAMALKVKKNAIRMRLRWSNSQRIIPLAVSPPEELFDTKSNTNSSQPAVAAGWRGWRVKVGAKTRYWTKVCLRGPVTPDEAKALLMRENIAVACVEQAAATSGRTSRSGDRRRRGGRSRMGAETA